MNYDVIPIESKYLDQVVAVHMRAFPNFFLSFLGPKFLKEFYQSFIVDEAGVGFVAKESGTEKILGAIVGPVVPDGYFKRLLKRRWWAFCLASLKAVSKKPSISKRLFRAVFYRGQSPTGPTRALLSSIAVSPDCQQCGVGRALVVRWTREVVDRGGSGCFLTTDVDHNEAVNAFYQKLGWSIESTYTTPEGRRMHRYIYDFQ
jgi:ribosomal protein S18 acetylase RimI-like enzyme